MITIESVDDRSFRVNLEKFSRTHKGDIGNTLRQQGRLLAVRLAQKTLPLGLSAALGKTHRSKIEADIRRSAVDFSWLVERIAEGGSAWGERLHEAFKKGDMEAVRAMLANSNWSASELVSTPVKSKHKNARGNNGRVKAVLPPSDRQLVTSPAQLNRFVKKESQKAGMAKGGWAGGAGALGGIRGIPAWVHKHREWGSAIDRSQQGDRPHIVLKNRIHYIDAMITQGRVQEAIFEQRTNFEKMMVYKMRSRGRRKL